MDDFWDSQLEYLSRTRGLYYNDDYLEFLVKQVWKLTSPVRLLDFGCGYGYLGTKLMPLLPKGSTYTGIDVGAKLIDRAKDLFRDAPFDIEFILGDLQEMDVDQKYEVVVCHAFLLHVSNPTVILQKMLDTLIDGGRIICFEPHWISSMANYYMDGNDLSDMVSLGFLQELFEKDVRRSGKDGNVGIKIPVYMSQLGVKHIECRVSDKVNFLDPHAEEAIRAPLYRALKEDGFGAEPSQEEMFIENLMNRGVAYEVQAGGIRGASFYQ